MRPCAASHAFSFASALKASAWKADESLATRKRTFVMPALARGIAGAGSGASREGVAQADKARAAK